MSIPFKRCGLAAFAAACVGLAGCATQVSAPAADAPGFLLSGWHAVPLPGKAATSYTWVNKDGRMAIAAHAERSASMWRSKVDRAPERVGEARFSWRVDQLIPGANVAVAELEDAPARVIFAFAGDVGKLPARTRMMFELAHALTGEAPPYATLMYVWEGSAPVDSVIVNPRTDRVRKIVLDSGPANLGQWRSHKRNLAEDFRRAFGEDPGPLVAVAVMTDADNTRSSARAWYGSIDLD